MIKLIATDMDGTLLGNDHKVAPETLKAIHEACDAGIRFMIATGRNFKGAMEELKETLMYTLTNDYGMDEEKIKQICGLENTNDYTREIELYSLGEAK